MLNVDYCWPSLSCIDHLTRACAVSMPATMALSCLRVCGTPFIRG
jgi:hypothetical protein